MGFRVLDDYPRRPHLDFYRGNPLPFYSVSFDLDVTSLRRRAKQTGHSTYLAMCWAFHRALLGVEAFRVRWQDGVVVLYDSLHVGMTVPAPRGTFTFATPPWHDDGPTFLAAAAAVVARASLGVDLSGGAAPDFAYYTALPRVPFTSFAHVMLADADAGQPGTAFGRFREQDGRTLVPVGLTVNHRYVDGNDLGSLYEAASASFDRAF
ncbi:MAG: CatA-like O-acetyltransferase [Vicinamibacteria bacterium]|nr:CatA-like O-acetyltransferase [Vicinamibacteria bacterium]